MLHVTVVSCILELLILLLRRLLLLLLLLLWWWQTKGWALDLSGGEMLSEEGFSFFGVNIGVTPEGLQHVDEIIDSVYQYVRMLREQGPQARGVLLVSASCLLFMCVHGVLIGCCCFRCVVCAAV